MISKQTFQRIYKDKENIHPYTPKPFPEPYFKKQITKKMTKNQCVSWKFTIMTKTYKPGNPVEFKERKVQILALRYINIV